MKIELNGVNYRIPQSPVAVICVDGGDPEYIEAARKAGAIPAIARFMESGFTGAAHCVIPSFTNPNNLSIATGAPPAVHGVSGNFYLDRHTGEAVPMTGPAMMRSRTIFDVFSRAGVETAVITAKDKLRRQLGKGMDMGNGNICFSSQCADRCTLLENGIQDALGWVGRPLPGMYSDALSLFVLDAGIRFLEAGSRPRLAYLSLTDYVQHRYPPDHPVALEFFQSIDRRCAKLDRLGATVALVADHGMKDKCAADGAYNIIYLQDLLDRRFGTGKTRVICPITDAFVGHHGALGGFVRVYCFEDLNVFDAIRFIESIDGVESVLAGADAASRFGLPLDVEGDAVVIASGAFCIGMTPGDHDLEGLHGERLRSHGGISEREVPFILNRPLNREYQARAGSEQLMNYHIFEYALNGVR
ncbi:MAG: phosphonoacetate hydrolase [Gemmatimonadota bacterium]|nr:phosphonoacetate hydrolase [Gemmatimonadota bacterium]